MFLLPLRAHLRITGPDRIRYLNGQLTQNLRTLLPGHTVPSCVTDAKGRLQAEVFVAATEDALLVDAPLELEESLHARLEKYLIADDVHISPDPDVRLIHVLTDSPSHPAVLDPFPRYKACRLGLPGWDIRISREAWDVLGQVLGKQSASEKDWESMRVLNGIPAWGKELEPNMLPPEAGLDRTHIAYHKGCYIGQEILSRIKSAGRLHRKLLRWQLSSPTLPSPGAPLYPQDSDRRPGSEAGTLTSVANTSEGPRGLGYVKTSFSQNRFVLETGEEILALPLPECVS